MPSALAPTAFWMRVMMPLSAARTPECERTVPSLGPYQCPAGSGNVLLGATVAVQLTDASLQYPTASFPNVRQGDRFVVDGHTWIASAGATRLQDGGESIVPIAKAGA